MAILPLRWQGVTHSERVRSEIESRSRAWLKEWSASDAECQVARPSSPPMHDAPSATWLRASGNSGGLCVRLTTATYGEIGCRLVDLPMSEGCDMGIGIGRRALTDLAAQLVGAGANVETLAAGESPTPAATEPRCGVVELAWSLAGCVAEIYVDAALCDAIASRATDVAEALVPREKAVLPADITLEAVLDLGCVALVDTVALRPGEVIKTDIPLDAHIEVRGTAGKTIFTGALVAADGHRALQCASITHG